MASITASPESEKAAQAGLIAGVACYTIWGFQVFLFKWLDHVPAATVVANRTIWSLLLVGVILLAMRRMGEVRVALADPITRRTMLISAAILGVNWLIYVYAIETGQVIEASFGYFINPLMNIAIGMIFFGERQSPLQTGAIALAVVAIVIQAIGLGGVPVIALGLAITFAGYAYIRKTAKTSSATGLFVETLLISPVAAGYLIFTFVRDGGIGPHGDPATLGLLLLTGPVTTFTLLLFAFAVRRIRLTTTGMLQYLSPSISFVIAITIFGEHLNTTRLVSFLLIWVCLVVFSIDSLLRRRPVVEEPI